MDKESAKFDEKYQKAKSLAPADIKLILLGDSAVGKSK
jgi:GTPase SAR1 family protein